MVDDHDQPSSRLAVGDPAGEVSIATGSAASWSPHRSRRLLHQRRDSAGQPADRVGAGRMITLLLIAAGRRGRTRAPAATAATSDDLPLPEAPTTHEPVHRQPGRQLGQHQSVPSAEIRRVSHAGRQTLIGADRRADRRSPPDQRGPAGAAGSPDGPAHRQRATWSRSSVKPCREACARAPALHALIGVIGDS